MRKFLGNVWSGMLKAASVRTWAIIGAAPILTATVWAIIKVVSDRAWGQSVLQINVLANIAYGSLIIISIIVAALTGTSIAANVSKGGAGLTLTQDDDDDTKTFAIEGEVKATPEPK
jgi:hypothetical protein